MSQVEYQVIARKYRPLNFQQVVDQESTVTTLKNALKFSLLSHAYLFSGPRGTGKTTLARIFAKALNCSHLSIDQEPCNQCSSCKDIMSGNCLDVLEIDGASHRGIEDIRQINETCIYAPRHNYKIYLIDEVHMLTKEAFNALLKTLEEPPGKVKFFFATTEPHKIPTTIISRCQRFNLNRISHDKMIAKLQNIAADFNVKIETSALNILAQFSEGALRDAEMLLDQVLTFHSEEIKREDVEEILGILPKERLFALDRATHTVDEAFAFKLADELYNDGKNITHFLDELLEHFRTLFLLQLSQASTPIFFKEQYCESASYYNQEQCLHILDLVIHAQQEMRSSSFRRIALEILLLKIIRSKKRLFLDHLIERLQDLELKVRVADQPKGTVTEDPTPLMHEIPAKKPTTYKKNFKSDAQPAHQSRPDAPQSTIGNQEAGSKNAQTISISSSEANRLLSTKLDSSNEKPPTLEKVSPLLRTSRHDTLMRFAAKELDGQLKI